MFVRIRYPHEFDHTHDILEQCDRLEVKPTVLEGGGSTTTKDGKPKSLTFRLLRLDKGDSGRGESVFTIECKLGNSVYIMNDGGRTIDRYAWD